MAKKLRIRDRLLLGLALMGDLADEIWGKGGYAYRIRSLNFWAPPGYKPANFYHSIWRMLRTGYIEKVIKDGKPFLRLTSFGEKRMARDFSLLQTRKRRWNKKWCLVVFDIEEKRKNLRESLREKLTELGFGKLQRSVYISPYDFSDDLAEYFENRGILGRVFVLVCKHRLMGDPKELASFVWSLEKLNRRYKKILKRFKKAKVDKNTKLMEKTKEQFLKIVLKDPFLPSELLPDNWYGNKVFRLLGL